ncbi:unnamed protein product [Menidia menidia]|uniref:(Atlantic silverside) hypothetical protein n=1 Tax=Menidia menidia TaxID=238744 RepID=A0A8S4ANB5_9TELE|nr:unnamed protein product [Menidia menidia]
MEGESTESGTTTIQAETLTQSCSEEGTEIQNLLEGEEETKADNETCDGEIMKAGEDLCVIGAEMLPQETLIATGTEGDDDFVPLSPLPTEEEMGPPSVSSHPSNTQNRPSEPCWYCLRSLDSEYRPKAAKQENTDAASTPPTSEQKVTYQTDPRPHFGVACSSRSTCRPLWGREGPCWGQRNQELPEQTDTCPHCHLGLPPDTLRWHEAKCMLFDGLRSLKK